MRNARRAIVAPVMTDHVIKVRKASRDDAKALAVLMQALNDHLNEPGEAITAAAITRDLLTSESYCSVLVAEHDDGLVGYALFHETYESINAQRGYYMADLFVTQSVRRKGIGRALVSTVAAQARQQGQSFVWWASEAWDEEAQAFYAALGASHNPMISHELSHEGIEALVGTAET